MGPASRLVKFGEGFDPLHNVSVEEVILRKFAGIPCIFAVGLVLSGAVACDDDGPTDPGTPPLISQLQVTSIQRAAGDAGAVGLTFDYSDPDADIATVTFTPTGSASAINAFPEPNAATGRATLLQAVTLPAAGTTVAFAIFVTDREGHASNALTGSFVSPP